MAPFAMFCAPRKSRIWSRKYIWIQPLTMAGGAIQFQSFLNWLEAKMSPRMCISAPFIGSSLECGNWCEGAVKSATRKCRRMKMYGERISKFIKRNFIFQVCWRCKNTPQIGMEWNYQVFLWEFSNKWYKQVINSRKNRNLNRARCYNIKIVFLCINSTDERKAIIINNFKIMFWKWILTL